MTETFASRDEFDQAVAEARRAARAYYDSGDVLMTDADYDALADRIAAATATHPEWDDQGVTTAVAAGSSAGGDVRHPTPMLSLDKITTPEEVAAFVATLGGDGCLVEVKLDGLAIRAEYVSGALTLAALRGDGSTGEDVTGQVRRGIAGLPVALGSDWTGEVRGEVYMTVADFEASSANRVAAGGKAFVNSRGAVAGAIRSVDRVYECPMTFAAYEISGEFDTHLERMAFAGTLGFPAACGLIPSVAGERHTAEEVTAAIEEIGAHRDDLDFPIDGAVIKANRDSTRRRLGLASRTPYWAAAFKYPPDTAATVLRDIEVRVGRTGRITLRAVIDPVYVAGTTVTRATLHNPQWVLDQGLAIGQTVAVWRAGDVIPRVTTPIGEQPHDLLPWAPPEVCPQCGEAWDKSSLLWRCHTPSCSLVGAVTYAAGRDCLDVDGLGEEIVIALVESGLVRDLADLFTLTAEQFATTRTGEGNRQVGASTAARIMAGLEHARQQPFNRVITALGIRMTGRSVGRWLASRFKTMDALRAATVEEIAEIDKMGLIKAQHVVDGLAAMSGVIDRLAAAGLAMAVADDGAAKPLAGQVYVVSGSVPGYTRTTVSERIEALGGTASGSVSAKTTALVTAETGTSKAKKAAQLGIPVLDPEEFARMLA
ncbi:putative NAD-dependent DNA ligase [Actinoplanes missouriensis 431]|uniref:DNA ligase n=1 Tax=Actinoplanes missouriensis (strain ATCC 14538 / DSM 43046 / CBS 188.64 / JCM 3121 / NBRC 102363 / NCIMB 12654 / NRRL B-3342 / UNCC 431) TaxID=512565 RepID=I0H9Z3_ACTM4|nr:NAD-dependent DNA ligase LigA [Actinoplanes missouriensis]BAL89830.1 putative NAD-dependent DNA ligase [Actinoplanes missouriensis 431]